jgi:hypothetical protein
VNCPHGFAKPAMCVDCMVDGPVTEPVRWRKEGAPFAARHAAVCADGDCGGQLHVGERVQRWDLGDQRTVYTHEEGCRP